MTKPGPSTLDIAKATLLTPFGLDEGSLQKVFGTILAHRADDADLYFQYNRSEGWTLEEGQVKNGSFSIDQGVGVRVVTGEKTAFAYADDLTTEALDSAAKVTRAIAASGGEAKVAAMKPRLGSGLYAPIDPVSGVGDAEKVRLLETVERLASAQDPRVKQVIGRLSGEYDVVLVARADGTLAADVRPLVHLSLSVIVEQDGRREQGNAGGGGRFGYGHFDDKVLRRIADEAVRQALTNLESRPAPAGMMSVVLGPGWPGILLHEAIGHGLEGDFNRKGTSAFSGRIGERVAAKGVTVVDDGTIPDRRGSLSIDDEGNPTGHNVLIEDGILRGYMQDSLNARLMGVAPTGNGRRESYASLPMPRMTNTYMHAGDKDPGEILASLDRGIYCANFGGGEVDITNGKFVFSASEAWWVEGGKKLYPVKGATLIGNGPDALTRVSLIGNDLALDPGIGMCGKEGQSVPVGVGQPTLRIEGLTIGGTA
ncbi:metalloprotease TldD [Betaproteobacteria bacterium GR16-43]|nr:metalloprotease TldD [Betaproteobacteria bacterium GR16-43]